MDLLLFLMEIRKKKGGVVFFFIYLGKDAF